MKLYCKWLDSGKYSQASINKNGDFYILNEIKVQRGMGHEKANELLILGIPKTKIAKFCQKNNCQIIERENEIPREKILILDSKGEVKSV